MPNLSLRWNRSVKFSCPSFKIYVFINGETPLKNNTKVFSFFFFFPLFFFQSCVKYLVPTFFMKKKILFAVRTKSTAPSNTDAFLFCSVLLVPQRLHGCRDRTCESD